LAWLRAIGVRSRADMAELGSIGIYRALKLHGYPATANFVYALEGALRDVDWRRLPARLRRRLKSAVDHATKPRCRWAGADPLYIRYHDEEWGVPVHDDRTLFEFLILEGAQAGLSWITILRKREAYRRAFDRFDPARVARYDRAKIARLMRDPGIVRNRLKIESTVTNARAFLAVRDEFGRFDRYLWRFVDGRPIVNRWKPGQIPARTKISDQLSDDLAGRGFRFVGSTICYAFMQAVGMVNDHTTNCFRHRELARRR
jgi:DNA-3-methyladenine glycosylase I